MDNEWARQETKGNASRKKRKMHGATQPFFLRACGLSGQSVEGMRQARLIKEAAFSATMMVGALVLPDGTLGMRARLVIQNPNALSVDAKKIHARR